MGTYYYCAVRKGGSNRDVRPPRQTGGRNMLPTSNVYRDNPIIVSVTEM